MKINIIVFFGIILFIGCNSNNPVNPNTGAPKVKNIITFEEGSDSPDLIYDFFYDSEDQLDSVHFFDSNRVNSFTVYTYEYVTDLKLIITVSNNGNTIINEYILNESGYPISETLDTTGSKFTVLHTYETAGDTLIIHTTQGNHIKVITDKIVLDNGNKRKFFSIDTPIYEAIFDSRPNILLATKFDFSPTGRSIDLLKPFLADGNNLRQLEIVSENEMLDYTYEYNNDAYPISAEIIIENALGLSTIEWVVEYY